jgi:hypothetical protein
MSAQTISPPPQTVARPSDREADRYDAVRQYSLAKILGVWAAAAVPMGALAWIVAPWLGDQIGGRDPFGEALLICLTAGLIWQFLLVFILVTRELGGLRRARVRDALWLRPPRDPKTARVGGKVWWWAGLFAVLVTVWSLVAAGAIPGAFAPGSRQLPQLGSRRGLLQRRLGLVRARRRVRRLQHRARRGAALPRAAAAAHARCLRTARLGRQRRPLHALPPAPAWSMPATLVEGIFFEAYPARRFQSAWMGIIVHSVQSVFVIAAVLALVL